MKNKSVLALTLTLALTLNSNTLIFADNEYTELNNKSEDSTVRVKSDIDSTYSVTIPKKIVMSGDDKKAEYKVSVSSLSDIAGYESLIVKPVTNTLSLKSSNKDYVTMSVSQDKDSWLYNEFNTEATGTITEQTKGTLSAGSWTGTFDFKVLLVNNLIGVTATNSSGKDLNAYAVSLSSDKTTELINILKEEGYIETEDDIQGMVNIYTDSFDGTSNVTVDLSKVSKVGDRVAVIHYDEETGYFDAIKLDYVDSTYKFSGKLDSFSPIMVIKVNNYNHDELLMTQPGLYDANEKLIVSWDDSGILDQVNYHYWSGVTGTTYPKSSKTSAYYITTVTHPETRKIVINKNQVGNFILAYCSGITDVYIGAKMEETSCSMFSACTNLKTVKVSKNNKIFDSRDNCNGVMYTETDALIAGCKATVIPDTTKIISMAFYEVGNWNGTIPDSVTTIGGVSFEGDTALTNLVIPDSVTEIGGGAFGSCNNLKYVTIGSNVVKMGQDPFVGCNQLVSVTFKNPYNWKATKINSSTLTYYAYDQVPDNIKIKTYDISGQYLSNPSTAKTYLISTYCNYYVWARD